MKDYNSLFDSIKMNRKDRRSKKAQRSELIKELMHACRTHGRLECLHDFKITRSREETDRIVVDIPSADEVHKHWISIEPLLDKVIKSLE